MPKITLNPCSFSQNNCAQDIEMRQDDNNDFTKSVKDFKHSSEPCNIDKETINISIPANNRSSKRHLDETPLQDKIRKFKKDEALNSESTQQNEIVNGKDLNDIIQTVKKAKNSLVQGKEFYKKFAVGSFVHLLNEPVVQPIKKIEKTNVQTTETTKIKNSELNSQLKEKSPKKQLIELTKNQECSTIRSDTQNIATNVKLSGKKKRKKSKKSSK